jgi:phosphopantetheinyl transferase
VVAASRQGQQPPPSLTWSHCSASKAHGNTAQVTSPAALQHYSSLLTPEELSSCHGSTRPEAAKERILARAFVRSVLAQYVAGPAPPERLVFDRNQHGKPSLAWPRLTALGYKVHFNLTHTNSLIGKSSY